MDNPTQFPANMPKCLRKGTFTVNFRSEINPVKLFERLEKIIQGDFFQFDTSGSQTFLELINAAERHQQNAENGAPANDSAGKYELQNQLSQAKDELQNALAEIERLNDIKNNSVARANDLSAQLNRLKEEHSKTLNELQAARIASNQPEETVTPPPPPPAPAPAPEAPKTETKNPLQVVVNFDEVGLFMINKEAAARDIDPETVLGKLFIRQAIDGPGDHLKFVWSKRQVKELKETLKTSE